MKPILYESTETNFDPQTRTFGLGVLSDCISPKVTEELNGPFEFEMDYPIDGVHYKDLQLDRIVLSPSRPRQTRAQAFRIYEITRPINGIVSVHAKHISYDMSDYVVEPKFENDITVKPVTATTVAEATSALVELSFPAGELPFYFSSDITTEGEFSIKQPASVRSFLGTDEGALVDVFGGEWEFDNFHCILHSKRGADKGLRIVYGVNMTDLEQEENIEEMYTAVYPYAVYENGNLTYVYRLNPAVSEDVELAPNAPLIKVDGTFEREKVISLDTSSNYNIFPYDRIDPTPTDRHETTQSGKPTRYQLVNAALYYIKENDIGKPKVNLKVSFIDAWKHIGKEIFHEVGLGDTVHVYFDRLGVESSARCTKVTYNVIQDRYENIELDSDPSTLADTIASANIEVNKTRKEFPRTINEATAAITGNRGGYVVLHDTDLDEQPDEILIMDRPSVADAQTVWRYNLRGWGVSDNGYNGPYEMAAYMRDEYDRQGHLIHKKGFVADYITTGTLRSLKIQNGVIDQTTGKAPFEVDEDGNLYAMSGTFSGRVAVRHEEETTSTGTNFTDIYINDPDMTAPFIVESGKIFEWTDSSGTVHRDIDYADFAELTGTSLRFSTYAMSALNRYAYYEKGGIEIASGTYSSPSTQSYIRIGDGRIEIERWDGKNDRLDCITSVGGSEGEDRSYAVFADKRDGSTSKYLRGDGTWQVPPNSTYPNAITNITRSGTTFTATRYNGTTFTFTQQDTDTNTWNPNAITGISRNGTTFTATRQNGTTFTFTQQDNNTTYGVATTSANGLMAAGDKTNLNNVVGWINRGQFTGNLNSTTISPGLYKLGAATSYSGTKPSPNPTYCLFIQSPAYNTQIIIDGSEKIIVWRDYTGNPAKWGAWKKITGTT